MSVWENLKGLFRAPTTAKPEPAASPARLGAAPKPKRIFISKAFSRSTDEECMKAFDGFFLAYPKVREADILGNIPFTRIMTLSTDKSVQLQATVEEIFKNNAYLSAYYLDAIVDALSETPIFFVMVWDGEAALAAERRFPGGTRR